MCLFCGYIWSYWIFPLWVPVLHCESQKGSRDGLLLFGTYWLFFNTFFPECLPCDSIHNSPEFSWKTISYFLAFLCQHYPGFWLMLTSVIICDFPPKLSISTQATEWCSPIHSNYECDIWDSWKRVLRMKKWDGKQQLLLSQMNSKPQLRLSSKLPLKPLRILLARPMLWSLFFSYKFCVWIDSTLLRYLKQIVLSWLCSFACDNQGQSGFFLNRWKLSPHLYKRCVESHVKVFVWICPKITSTFDNWGYKIEGVVDLCWGPRKT